MSQDIHARVAKVISSQFKVEESKITTEASFVDDLGADSLDLVELIMALEDEFECEIPDTEVEKIRTVGEVVNYIDKHSSDN